jgi:hypothetical protein
MLFNSLFCFTNLWCVEISCLFIFFAFCTLLSFPSLGTTCVMCFYFCINYFIWNTERRTIEEIRKRKLWVLNTLHTQTRRSMYIFCISCDVNNVNCELDFYSHACQQSSNKKLLRFHFISISWAQSSLELSVSLLSPVRIAMYSYIIIIEEWMNESIWLFFYRINFYFQINFYV